MGNSSGDYKKPSAIWKLSDTISIVEAALLLLDIEPQGISENIECWDDDKKPDGYLAARNALESSIKKKSLEGEMNYVVFESPNGGYDEDYQRFDYSSSHVDRLALTNWLAIRGFSCSTFPPLTDNPIGFRDPNHPRYSAKLAAVAEAWENYDESSTEPGTPKQRLMKWLRLNAARFGLANEEGFPMDNVIEELAKVANWATAGGAPRQNSEEPIPF